MIFLPLNSYLIIIATQNARKNFIQPLPGSVNLKTPVRRCSDFLRCNCGERRLFLRHCHNPLVGQGHIPAGSGTADCVQTGSSRTVRSFVDSVQVQELPTAYKHVRPVPSAVSRTAGTCLYPTLVVFSRVYYEERSNAEIFFCFYKPLVERGYLPAL